MRFSTAIRRILSISMVYMFVCTNTAYPYLNQITSTSQKKSSDTTLRVESVFDSAADETKKASNGQRVKEVLTALAPTEQQPASNAALKKYAQSVFDDSSNKATFFFRLISALVTDDSSILKKKHEPIAKKEREKLIQEIDGIPPQKLTEEGLNAFINSARVSSLFFSKGERFSFPLVYSDAVNVIVQQSETGKIAANAPEASGHMQPDIGGDLYVERGSLLPTAVANKKTGQGIAKKPDQKVFNAALKQMASDFLDAAPTDKKDAENFFRVLKALVDKDHHACDPNQRAMKRGERRKLIGRIGNQPLSKFTPNRVYEFVARQWNLGGRYNHAIALIMNLTTADADSEDKLPVKHVQSDKDLHSPRASNADIADALAKKLKQKRGQLSTTEIKLIPLNLTEQQASNTNMEQVLKNLVGKPARISRQEWDEKILAKLRGDVSPDQYEGILALLLLHILGSDTPTVIKELNKIFAADDYTPGNAAIYLRDIREGGAHYARVVEVARRYFERRDEVHKQAAAVALLSAMDSQVAENILLNNENNNQIFSALIRDAVYPQQEQVGFVDSMKIAKIRFVPSILKNGTFTVTPLVDFSGSLFLQLELRFKFEGQGSAWKGTVSHRIFLHDMLADIAGVEHGDIPAVRLASNTLQEDNPWGVARYLLDNGCIWGEKSITYRELANVSSQNIRTIRKYCGGLAALGIIMIDQSKRPNRVSLVPALRPELIDEINANLIQQGLSDGLRNLSLYTEVTPQLAEQAAEPVLKWGRAWSPKVATFAQDFNMYEAVLDENMLTPEELAGLIDKKDLLITTNRVGTFYHLMKRGVPKDRALEIAHDRARSILDNDTREQRAVAALLKEMGIDVGLGGKIGGTSIGEMMIDADGNILDKGEVVNWTQLLNDRKFQDLSSEDAQLLAEIIAGRIYAAQKRNARLENEKNIVMLYSVPGLVGDSKTDKFSEMWGDITGFKGTGPNTKAFHDQPMGEMVEDELKQLDPSHTYTIRFINDSFAGLLAEMSAAGTLRVVFDTNTGNILLIGTGMNRTPGILGVITTEGLIWSEMGNVIVTQLGYDPTNVAHSFTSYARQWQGDYVQALAELTEQLNGNVQRAEVMFQASGLQALAQAMDPKLYVQGQVDDPAPDQKELTRAAIDGFQPALDTLEVYGWALGAYEAGVLCDGHNTYEQPWAAPTVYISTVLKRLGFGVSVDLNRLPQSVREILAAREKVSVASNNQTEFVQKFTKADVAAVGYLYYALENNVPGTGINEYDVVRVVGSQINDKNAHLDPNYGFSRFRAGSIRRQVARNEIPYAQALGLLGDNELKTVLSAQSLGPRAEQETVAFNTGFDKVLSDEGIKGIFTELKVKPNTIIAESHSAVDAADLARGILWQKIAQAVQVPVFLNTPIDAVHAFTVSDDDDGVIVKLGINKGKNTRYVRLSADDTQISAEVVNWQDLLPKGDISTIYYAVDGLEYTGEVQYQLEGVIGRHVTPISVCVQNEFPQIPAAFLGEVNAALAALARGENEYTSVPFNDDVDIITMRFLGFTHAGDVVLELVYNPGEISAELQTRYIAVNMDDPAHDIHVREDNPLASNANEALERYARSIVDEGTDDADSFENLFFNMMLALWKGKAQLLDSDKALTLVERLEICEYIKDINCDSIVQAAQRMVGEGGERVSLNAYSGIIKKIEQIILHAPRAVNNRSSITSNMTAKTALVSDGDTVLESNGGLIWYFVNLMRSLSNALDKSVSADDLTLNVVGAVRPRPFLDAVVAAAVKLDIDRDLVAATIFGMGENYSLLQHIAQNPDSAVPVAGVVLPVDGKNYPEKLDYILTQIAQLIGVKRDVVVDLLIANLDENILVAGISETSQGPKKTTWHVATALNTSALGRHPGLIRAGRNALLALRPLDMSAAMERFRVQPTDVVKPLVIYADKAKTLTPFEQPMREQEVVAIAKMLIAGIPLVVVTADAKHDAVNKEVTDQVAEKLSLSGKLEALKNLHIVHADPNNLTSINQWWRFTADESGSEGSYSEYRTVLTKDAGGDLTKQDAMEQMHKALRLCDTAGAVGVITDAKNAAAMFEADLGPLAIMVPAYVGDSDIAQFLGAGVFISPSSAMFIDGATGFINQFAAVALQETAWRDFLPPWQGHDEKVASNEKLAQYVRTLLEQPIVFNDTADRVYRLLVALRQNRTQPEPPIFNSSSPVSIQTRTQLPDYVTKIDPEFLTREALEGLLRDNGQSVEEYAGTIDLIQYQLANRVGAMWEYENAVNGIANNIVAKKMDRDVGPLIKVLDLALFKTASGNLDFIALSDIIEKLKANNKIGVPHFMIINTLGNEYGDVEKQLEGLMPDTEIIFKDAAEISAIQNGDSKTISQFLLNAYKQLSPDISIAYHKDNVALFGCSKELVKTHNLNTLEVQAAIGTFNIYSVLAGLFANELPAAYATNIADRLSAEDMKLN